LALENKSQFSLADDRLPRGLSPGLRVRVRRSSSENGATVGRRRATKFAMNLRKNERRWRREVRETRLLIQKARFREQHRGDDYFRLDAIGKSVVRRVHGLQQRTDDDVAVE
jgi:hypothetical protein